MKLSIYVKTDNSDNNQLKQKIASYLTKVDVLTIRAQNFKHSQYLQNQDKLFIFNTATENWLEKKITQISAEIFLTIFIE